MHHPPTERWLPLKTYIFRAKRVSNSHLRSPRNSALLEKKRSCVCVFVRFNLNLDWVTRKMSAVVADHTSDDSYIYQLSLVLATATSWNYFFCLIIILVFCSLNSQTGSHR